MSTSHSPHVAGLSRVRLIVLGVVLLLVACGLGVLISLQVEPFAIDTWWNALLFDLASPLLIGVSQVMNFAGAGWFGVIAVPVVGAIGLLLLRKRWAALFFIVASIASAAVVQLLKALFGRARPEEILVLADPGSFPSGHAANGATLATVAVLLFPRLWVFLVAGAWMLLMAFSRTALHAHWLSDVVGGMLIGIGVVLVVAGLFSPLLERESTRLAERTRR